jgi:uncharacterized phage-associated protein
MNFGKGAKIDYTIELLLLLKIINGKLNGWRHKPRIDLIYNKMVK